MVAVSDSGSGMTREVIDRAFEPFFTTKPTGVGTGLGLSQVYGFVKQSGGHIRIYSEIGEGTTIKLYFPRLTQTDVPALDRAGSRAGSDADPRTAPRLVLVVEDDAAGQQARRRGAAGARLPGDLRLGWRLGVAADRGHAADRPAAHRRRAAGRHERPRTDRRVRALRPAIKVLYMTGYTRNAIIHHGRLDPDIDLLTKPFTADALARKIRRSSMANAKPAGYGMALRSRITTDGLDRTPHRAFMRAMGLDDAAIAKPMIGVVSQKGETTPCNMTHGPQVDAAKDGVSAAGGTPREFTTISVSDGIGMNHEGMKFSLVSRELIADSIEAVVQGHAYDGLVAFGGCDKTLPGAMMGLVRCNVPGVFLFGGAALPGRFEGRDVTVLDAYEGVGAVQTGAMSESDLEVLERACKPSIGACAGQFTANTMAMVAEALGLTVPNSAMVPGVYSERLAIAKRAGEIVMQIVRSRRSAAARSRDAPRAGERKRDRGRNRRLDQRGAAHSGDRQRGRHPLHRRRCRRGFRTHAADRRSAAGRKISREGRVRTWRRVGHHPRAGRERTHGW